MDYPAYFIQYKFIIPNNMKHSSYTYQKLFRALYGYTQSVSKSNGKSYNYYRKGLLSDVPHLRPGKNCVIIPQNQLSDLISFFKTGKNPTHKWELKGDWKAVYYMDEKKLDEELVVKAVEDLLDRTYVSSAEKGNSRVLQEMEAIVEKMENNEEIDKLKASQVIDSVKKLTSNAWFKACNNKSSKLKEFNEKAKKLGSLHTG